MFINVYTTFKVSSGADTGGVGKGDNRPPPEFRIFCSYFQNSFSKACLRERNPSAKQEKISVLINYNVWKVKNLVF